MISVRRTEYWRRSFSSVLICSLALLFLNRAASGNDQINPSEDQTIAIVRGEPIFVPVEILGEKHNFALDTGATHGLVDDSFRERLRKPQGQTRVMTAGGAKQLDRFAAPKMKIGDSAPFLFESANAVGCVNMTPAMQASGLDDLRGVVGMDFLQSKVLRVNFDEGYAKIQTVATLDSGDSERMHFRLGCPHILVRLPSEGFQSFIIDTGSCTNITLEFKLYDRLVRRRRIVETGTNLNATANGDTIVRTGILDCLEFGPHRFHNLMVETGTLSLVGLKFLAKFDVELDFPNHTARFRPGRRIDLPDRIRRAGLGVGRSGGTTSVGGVDPNGIAAKAGIIDNDRIVQINGVAAEQMSLAEIRELFCEPGAELTLVVERNGVRNDVTLKLSNDLELFPQVPHEMIEIIDDFDK